MLAMAWTVISSILLPGGATSHRVFKLPLDLRLKIIELFKFNIKAEIITCSKKGSIFFIPRIILDTDEHTTLPFILYRRQFPIILAFSMTINNSKCQIF